MSNKLLVDVRVVRNFIFLCITLIFSHGYNGERKTPIQMEFTFLLNIIDKEQVN